MRIRTLLLVSAVSMTALAASASGASAATLFTNASHTTHVAVGTNGTATSLGFRLTSGTATVFNCDHGLWHFHLRQNSMGIVAATIYNASFAGCPNPLSFTGSWTIEIGPGGHSVVGGTTAWGMSITNFELDFLGGRLHGNITTGIQLTGKETAGTGLCMDLDKAGSLTHPLTSVGKLDAKFCFIGAAANWGLT